MDYSKINIDILTMETQNKNLMFKHKIICPKPLTNPLLESVAAENRNASKMQKKHLTQIFSLYLNAKNK